MVILVVHDAFPVLEPQPQERDERGGGLQAWRGVVGFEIIADDALDGLVEFFLGEHGGGLLRALAVKRLAAGPGDDG